MSQEYARKSKILLGIGVVLLVFLWETVVAHQHMPSPASPFVWAGLGSGALGCLVVAWWYRRRANLAAARDDAPDITL